jgi:hypothetical protein
MANYMADTESHARHRGCENDPFAATPQGTENAFTSPQEAVRPWSSVGGNGGEIAAMTGCDHSVPRSRRHWTRYAV